MVLVFARVRATRRSSVPRGRWAARECTSSWPRRSRCKVLERLAAHRVPRPLQEARCSPRCGRGIWRNFGPSDEVVAKVALLDPALLDRNVAVERVADAHDDGALELGTNPIRINDQIAIERYIDTGDRDLAVAVFHLRLSPHIFGPSIPDSSAAMRPSADQSRSAYPRAIAVISRSRTTLTDGIGTAALSASASARRTSLSANRKTNRGR